MLNQLNSVINPEKDRENGSILALISQAIEEKNEQLSSAFISKATELLIRSQIELILRSSRDLTNERLLIKAEEYLSEKYPHLDLGEDPAEVLLFIEGPERKELREYIEKLIDEEDFEQLFENIDDPETLDVIEQRLSAIYPHLDLSEDPAQEILEGTWKEEFEKLLDELVS